MVGVDRLAGPPHRIGGAQPGQDIGVVQDHFHEGIVAHRRPGRDIPRGTVDATHRLPRRRRDCSGYLYDRYQNVYGRR